MQYKIIRTEYREEPIEHALFGKKGGAQKGSTWDNHKYIARQKTGDTWRYFYSQAELAAAKAKQTGQKATNQAKAGVAKVKKAVADTKRYASDVNNTRNRYKEALQKTSDLITNARDRSTKAGNEARNMAFGASMSSKTAEAFDNAAREAKSKMKFITAKKYKNAADAARNDYEEFDKAGAKAFKKEVNAEKADTRANSNYIDLKNKEKAFEDSINPVKYGVSKALNKAEDAINKGKSAASKLLSNAKSASVDAVEKGKSALDKFLNYHNDVDDRINAYAQSSLKGQTLAKGSPARAVIDALTSSPKYKASKAVDTALTEVNRKQLESKADKAGREADRLGQKTDKLSDKAEKALQQYGRNSTQYKKAYDDLTDAFAELEKKEAELANYERQLEAYEKNRK